MKQPNAGQSECVCNKTEATAGCSVTEIFNPSTCTCDDCPYLKEREGGVCVCNKTAATAGCAANQTFDAAECRCLNCAADWINDGANNCVCDINTVRARCTAKEFVYVDVASCSCQPCPGNTIQDASGTSCACQPCPTGMGLADLEDCGCQACPADWQKTDGTWDLQNGQCSNPDCSPGCVDLNGDGYFGLQNDEIDMET